MASCSAISVCGRLSVQVDCISNIYQGEDAVINLRFLTSAGEILNLNNYSNIIAVLYNDLNSIIASFTYPSTTDTYELIIEDDGIAKLIIPSSLSSTIISSKLFLEIKLNEVDTLFDNDIKTSIIPCIQIGNVQSSIFNAITELPNVIVPNIIGVTSVDGLVGAVDLSEIYLPLTGGIITGKLGINATDLDLNTSLYVNAKDNPIIFEDLNNNNSNLLLLSINENGVISTLDKSTISNNYNLTNGIEFINDSIGIGGSFIQNTHINANNFTLELEGLNRFRAYTPMSMLDIKDSDTKLISLVNDRETGINFSDDVFNISNFLGISMSGASIYNIEPSIDSSALINCAIFGNISNALGDANFNSGMVMHSGTFTNGASSIIIAANNNTIGSSGEGTSYLQIINESYYNGASFINIESAANDGPSQLTISAHSTSNATTTLSTSDNNGNAYLKLQTNGIQISDGNSQYIIPLYDGNSGDTLVTDGNGNVQWLPRGSVDTIYTADGTLSGNRIINANTNSLTFKDINNLTIVTQYTSIKGDSITLDGSLYHKVTELNLATGNTYNTLSNDYHIKASTSIGGYVRLPDPAGVYIGREIIVENTTIGVNDVLYVYGPVGYLVQGDNLYQALALMPGESITVVYNSFGGNPTITNWNKKVGHLSATSNQSLNINHEKSIVEVTNSIAAPITLIINAHQSAGTPGSYQEITINGGIDASTHSVTILVNGGSGTINGQSNYIINNDNDSVTLYTFNGVAFNIKDRALNTEYIPLSGTTTGNNVTGNIEIRGGGLYYYEPLGFYFDNQDAIATNIGVSTAIPTDQLFWGVSNGINLQNGLSLSPSTRSAMLFSDLSGITNYIDVSDTLIVNDDVSNKGLVGTAYYGANYSDTTYVQKKYVDDAIAPLVIFAYSDQLQNITTANTPIDITFNIVPLNTAFTINSNKEIVILEPGYYNFGIVPQIKNNGNADSIYFYAVIDTGTGYVSIPGSPIRKDILGSTNSSIGTVTLIGNGFFNAGDKLKFQMISPSNQIQLLAEVSPYPGIMPDIPSVKLLGNKI